MAGKKKEKRKKNERGQSPKASPTGIANNNNKHFTTPATAVAVTGLCGVRIQTRQVLGREERSPELWSNRTW